MAKPYKSVLETYNERLKHRLPTAEEQAIEPVYPEEYLIGGPGKAVVSGLSKAEKAAAKAASRKRIAEETKIGSKARDYKQEAIDNEEFANSEWGKATYDYERKKAAEAAKARDINRIKDAAARSAYRTSTNFTGEAGMAIGSEMANQNRNAAGDTYKKGGSVKATASRRADGIASRGKTKGRFV